MSIEQTMAMARKYLGTGTMDSSARLCMADAVRLYDEGQLDEARARALASLRYSIGILHPDYRKAIATSPTQEFSKDENDEFLERMAHNARRNPNLPYWIRT